MASKETGEAHHAQELRDLGFSPIDKELSLQVRSTLPHTLSRNERRQLRKQKYRPWFTMTNEITFATDETGQSWHGPPNTDLSSLGYEDQTAVAEAGLSKMRNADPIYH